MLERIESQEENPPQLVGVLTCTGSWEKSMSASRKNENQSPSHPMIAFMAIYLQDTQSYQKDTWSTIFKAASFILVRT